MTSRKITNGQMFNQMFEMIVAIANQPTSRDKQRSNRETSRLIR